MIQKTYAKGGISSCFVRKWGIKTFCFKLIFALTFIYTASFYRKQFCMFSFEKKTFSICYTNQFFIQAPSFQLHLNTTQLFCFGSNSIVSSPPPALSAPYCEASGAIWSHYNTQPSSISSALPTQISNFLPLTILLKKLKRKLSVKSGFILSHECLWICKNWIAEVIHVSQSFRS
jgi:hypothetical protein